LWVVNLFFKKKTPSIEAIQSVNQKTYPNF
jgi:hypothetical protein